MAAIELKPRQGDRLNCLLQSKPGRQPTISKEEVEKIRALIDQKVPYKKIQIVHAVNDKMLTKIKQEKFYGY
jgi:hypothetical protein